MKSPFTRLRGLVNRKHSKHDVPNQLDELSQASQDMNEMKDCFDSLLSAAAATINSVYEFSESLREMGGCLLEKTSLNDDREDDTGRVLLMLGKEQFHIQDLVDNYRSHITRTITVPSESLLNELRIVEDMKRQCDHKRALYDEMKIRNKLHKRRLGGNKGEYVSSSQLKAAQEELEDDATLFVFRIKSLKGSQSRSLLTQAARHHAAQTSFFRKALKSLEAIEPHVKLVTQQQHIDYQFSGLEDDDRDSVFLTDDEDCEDDSDYATEYGELSFDYKRNDPKVEVSSSDNSMELDSADITFPQISSQNSVKVKPLWNSSTFNIGLNAGSKSAPLSAMSNTEPGEKFRQMSRQSSVRRLNTYVLPTPLQKATRLDTQRPSTTNMWHSSPLESKDKFSGPLVSNRLKETKPTPLPSPQIQIDTRSAFSAKKIKRHAFSGPLAPTAHSNKSSYSVSGPIGTTRHPPLQFSGSLFGTSLTRPASTTKLSSSPKITELHELPRPPPNISIKKPSQAGFSAPLLTFKDVNATNKSPQSSLPVPAESQNFKAAERMVSPPVCK
ncbi:putative arfaptin homology domain/BAR domain protein [Tanacetum coccineum]